MNRTIAMIFILSGTVLLLSGSLLSCSHLSQPAPTEFANQFEIVPFKPVVEDRLVTINGVHNFGYGIWPVWNWGDGTTDNSMVFPAMHVYSKPGTYKITLEIGITTFEGRIVMNAATEVTIE